MHKTTAKETAMDARMLQAAMRPVRPEDTEERATMTIMIEASAEEALPVVQQMMFKPLVVRLVGGELIITLAPKSE